MSLRQYKLQNCPHVLPDSRPTGSTKCETVLLYCPNLTLRAVQIAKRSLCTAQIAHPEQCHRQKHTKTLPFHSRPPNLRQCQNQNHPPALPKSHTPSSVTGENTQRHCPFTAAHQFSGSAITKTSHNTAQIAHRRQYQNQNPPTALPNLPNTSTQRQCQRTIINSPLPPCTLRSNLLRPPSSHHKKRPSPREPQGLGQILINPFSLNTLSS